MLFTANYLIVATYFLFVQCNAWECFKSNCYLAGNDKVSFKEAVAFCKTQGAELTSINSKEENDYLQKFCFNRYCWLGFTDEAVEGDWKWLDGSAVTFTGWASTKPSNKDGEDYAIRGRHWWADVKESSKFTPLCKKSSTNPPTGIPTWSPTNQPTGVPTWSPTNQPTGVTTWSPTPQPSNPPTRCTAWTKKVARTNCPSKISSKTFGIKACKPRFQKKLEVSLANMLYETCQSVCVYDYDNLKSAFFYKQSKGCYKYVKKGQCFKMKKFGVAMTQILQRQLKNIGC